MSIGQLPLPAMLELLLASSAANTFKLYFKEVQISPLAPQNKENKEKGISLHPIPFDWSGQGHCVVFFGKTLNSHSVSLHPGI